MLSNQRKRQVERGMRMRNAGNSCGCNCCTPGQTQHLGAGISLNQLIEAMTDPNKRFEFPMKPPSAEMELGKETRTTILISVALLAGVIAFAATR